MAVQRRRAGRRVQITGARPQSQTSVPGCDRVVKNEIEAKTLDASRFVSLNKKKTCPLVAAERVLASGEIAQDVRSRGRKRRLPLPWWMNKLARKGFSRMKWRRQCGSGRGWTGGRNNEEMGMRREIWDGRAWQSS